MPLHILQTQHSFIGINVKKTKNAKAPQQKQHIYIYYINIIIITPDRTPG